MSVFDDHGRFPQDVLTRSSRACGRRACPLHDAFPADGRRRRSSEFVDDRGTRTAERIARAVEDEARRIEVKFSRYRESSVVSEINRNAGRTPVAVDEETEMLVGSALELARLTGGRFDPTVGVLRRAWDFKSGARAGGEEIAALLPLVDAAAVSRARPDRLPATRGNGDRSRRRRQGVRRRPRRAVLLREEGIRAAIVNFAGDVRTIGSRGDGRPGRSVWSIRADRRPLPVRGPPALRRGDRDLGRLRARLRQGRRPLPPHPGREDRMARARRRVGDGRRGHGVSRRTVRDRRFPLGRRDGARTPRRRARTSRARSSPRREPSWRPPEWGFCRIFPGVSGEPWELRAVRLAIDSPPDCVGKPRGNPRQSPFPASRAERTDCKPRDPASDSDMRRRPFSALAQPR